ncbi:MAG: aspartate carbamoyltransferase [Chloroflexota bacterium]|nr:aspartate carbamoyltransferase [Chloroflexota bacterium]
MHPRDPRRVSRTLYLIPILLLMPLALLGAAYGFGSREGGDRQRDVAQRGSRVMPFDLERTTHTFTNLPTGGREVVVSDDGDAKQIRLIRSHLREESRRFAVGEFADPAAIHGDGMPGLAALRAGADRIEFRYEEVPNGAAIEYRTAEPSMVSALHEWFAAQRSDHGKHADHPGP